MPQVLRDSLLWAAYTGVFRPFWSLEILAEVQRNLGRVAHLTPEQVTRAVDVMRTTFPAAMIPVWPDHRLANLRNDPEDRHVLGVAVEAGARFIVTQNIRHFRPRDLAPHGIEAVTPDDFLVHLWETQPAALVSAVERMSLNLTRPHLTPAEILRSLSKFTPRFAAEAMEAFRS